MLCSFLPKPVQSHCFYSDFMTKANLFSPITGSAQSFFLGIITPVTLVCSMIMSVTLVCCIVKWPCINIIELN